jgi:predicted Zn-dependent protease
MMGRAYRQLGQPQKAIEVLQKQLAEYGHLEGCESTYFSLGRAYRDMGDTPRALKAFEDCLMLGAGRHGPDEYPLKHAREQIKQIRGQ